MLKKAKETILFILNKNSWFFLSIIVWIFGVGGRDFYLLPLLIGTKISLKKRNKEILNFLKILKKQKIILTLYATISALFILSSFLKLYSFKWNILDVGSYSNAIYNFTIGLNYNSFLQTTATADHFTPSLILISPLYALYPTSLWIIISKVLSYLLTPICVYWYLSIRGIHKNKKYIITSFFGLFFLLIYSPSVSSRLFEFSPSSLAPPFIILALIFLEKRNWKVFILISIFILGLKEHMGIFLIGFGLYEMFNKSKKIGSFLFLIGVFFTCLMIFKIMPHFREYKAFSNTIIDPFFDINGKFYYLIKMFAPLGFLPLIFWKKGIISAPAVAVNLISGRPGMYSTNFHYDDISSTLILFSCVLIFVEIKKNFLPEWISKVILLTSIISICLSLKPSPTRELTDSFPESHHLSMSDELKDILQKYPDSSMAVQNSIGPHIHSSLVTWMTQQSDGVCSPPKINSELAEIIILSKNTNHYGIDDILKCSSSLSENPKYSKLNEFKELIVFLKNK